jgi:hypothetical protein
MFFDAASRPPAKLTTQIFVVEEAEEGSLEDFDVFPGNEDPAELLAPSENLRNARCIGRNDRKAGSHRLERGHRESFVSGRKYEKVGGSQIASDSIAVENVFVNPGDVSKT